MIDVECKNPDIRAVKYRGSDTLGEVMNIVPGGIWATHFFGETKPIEIRSSTTSVVVERGDYVVVHDVNTISTCTQEEFDKLYVMQ